MVLPKPTGISKQQFDEKQAMKEEADFRYDVNQSLQSHRFAIDTLNAVVVENVELLKSLKSEYFSNFQQLFRNVKEDLEKFRQQIGDFRDEIKEMHLLHESFQDDLATKATMQSVLTFDHDICQKLRAIDKDISNIREEMNTWSYTLRMQSEHNMAKLKQDILSQPSELPAFHKVVDQKLELCDLNGQNSLIRSANNERQLQLVERKIENIYQLIKEIKLSQG